RFVGNRWMRAIRLRGDIGEAGFFHSNVTGGAAVDHAQLGQPDLLNSSLKVPLQRVGVTAIANHLQISVLIVPPLAEEILGWSDCHGEEEHDTDHAEGANTVAEQVL